MSHLTTQTITAILEGAGYLPAEELREIRQHLEDGCPVCAALLAREGPDLDTLLRIVAAQEALARLDSEEPLDQELAPSAPETQAIWAGVASELPGLGGLDPQQGLTGKGFEVPGLLSGGARETAPPRGELHQLRPSHRVPGSASDQERERRKVGSRDPRPAPDFRSGSWLLRIRRVALPVAAMAAAFTAFFYVWPNSSQVTEPETADLDAIKGTGQIPPEIRMQVAKGREGEGGAFELDGLVNDNATLLPTDTLLFELRTEREAYRYLFVLDGEGEITWLLPPADRAAVREAAGSRRVTVDRAYVALGLSDLTSPLQIVSAASSAPLDPVAELLPIYKEWSVTRGRDSEEPFRAGLSSISLTIAPTP